MNLKAKYQTPITCVDHLVTGESFELVFNTEADMLITKPQPDPEKLYKYYESEDYISHTDRKQSLFEFSYHVVKSLQLRSKTKHLSRLFPTKGLLIDVGAGTGDFVVRCQQAGWVAKGIEPNKTAKKQGQQKGVDYSSSLQNIKEGSVQCVTLWHVLEHLPNLEETVNELHRVLETDGRIVLAVPNFLSWDAQRYQSNWAAFDVPRHLWHFSPRAIERVFSAAGFVLEQKSPMYWDAFYIAILSEKLKGGKFQFLKGVINGFRSNWQARRTGMYSSIRYVLKKRI